MTLIRATPKTTPQPSPDLIAALPGTVYHGEVRRGMYATDASIYQQMPAAVVVPRHRYDVLETLAVARRFGVPVLGRGGGTSLAGQTTASEAIVIDFTHSMARLLEVDIARRRARVEPGLVRDTLNAALRQHGLMFAPETSTSNRATIGGMIANNSSGANSVRYGRTSEHVAALEIVLADGRTGRVSTAHAMGESAANPLADTFRALRGLARDRAPLIRERWPRVMRRVGGYGLDELLRGAMGDNSNVVEHNESIVASAVDPAVDPTSDANLARFLCGSEGTLALILEAEVELVPLPRKLGLVAIHAADQIELLRAVPELLALDPFQIELVDRPLVELARENPAGAALCGWVRDTPEALLFVEIEAESAAAVEHGLAEVERIARGIPGVYHLHRAANDLERAAMIELRKLALGLLQRMPGDAKPISFIEDACVPVESLADYIADAHEWCRELGLRWVSYGHASVGVIHFKPILNLRDAKHLDAMETLADRAVARVRELGGCWSGEHGDGIMRGARNREFWGDEMVELFRCVKQLFDPTGLLNPGKIVDTPRLTDPAILRYQPEYRAEWESSHFHFRDEGGFAAAVEMCNGTGVCRKVGSGTMCPSYMATRDEEATTRGRANALRLAMSGQLGGSADAAMASGELLEALDLCLECKACRSECPSNVDMAKMKAEVLAAHHAARGGAPLRDRIFGNIGAIARRAPGPWAPLINAMGASTAGRRAASALLGVAPQRTPPAFARSRFADAVRELDPEIVVGDNEHADVLLFVDTYLDAFEPEGGLDFVRLAHRRFGVAAGLASVGCCGRPLISKGLLPEAKANAERLVAALRAIPGDAPIVVMEPSCRSAIREDIPDLLDDPAGARRIARRVISPAGWIVDRINEGDGVGLDAGVRRLLYHGHCHEKAATEQGDAIDLFARLGLDARVPDSGCCGMAGSFGYEREHYDVSVAVGRQRLAPAVEAASTSRAIVADGFSCRHQIAHLTGREPVPLTSYLARLLLA